MDLIGKIKLAQVSAGEQAVMDNLKDLGMFEDVSTPKEQERDSIEPLKYQLKQWRRLVKYLPETDCDRDDVAEIEKLLKKQKASTEHVCKEVNAVAHGWVCLECRKYLQND